VKTLSTLLKADTGTARVNDFDVATHATDVRESISLTGQSVADPQWAENLVLGARLMHLKDPTGPRRDYVIDRLGHIGAVAGHRRHRVHQQRSSAMSKAKGLSR
jgi:ABC-type multidrug transport system ATPase subunit